MLSRFQNGTRYPRARGRPAKDSDDDLGLEQPPRQDDASAPAIGTPLTGEAWSAMMKARARRRRVTTSVSRIALLVLALGLWQYVGDASKSIGLAVSTPTQVADWVASWATGGHLSRGYGWSDLWATMVVAALGYLVGAGVGILAGCILGTSRWLRTFSEPFLALLNAFPKIALAPLLVIAMGSTDKMQVLFVAAGTCFITLYTVFKGLQTIHPVYLDHARILGANLAWRARVVYFPSIVGWLTAGLRLTAAWAIASTVLVEYLTSGAGLGTVVAMGADSDNAAQVLGGILVASLAALAVDQVLLAVSSRLSSWRLA